MAANITVYAAASLKESLDEIAKAHSAQTGDKVIVSYAGSSALAKQIENGAPADVFISADLDWMDYLQQRDLIDRTSRRNLVANQLVLIAPAANPSRLKIAPSFPLARHLGKERPALANPDAVPAGKYGKTALEKMGVWESVATQTARTENVRAALMLVSRAEAPYGIVYRTDALADKNVMIVDTFPPDSHPPIVYPVALTTTAARSGKAPAVKRFLGALQTDHARHVWQKYGFLAAPQKGNKP